MRILLLLILPLVLIGCTSSAKVNQIQTSNNYPNKLKLSALVYIPTELSARTLKVSPSGGCAGFSGSVDVSNGYQTAIKNGLMAALDKIEIVNSPPNPVMASDKHADILITCALSNENSSMNVNTSGFSTTINSQYQVSMNMQFMDRNGTSLYSYTANGSGFGNVDGNCSDIADAMQRSIEIGLRQVADYIAQSTYGAAQIKEYEKVVSK
jgi:hypothetical protein